MPASWRSSLPAEALVTQFCTGIRRHDGVSETAPLADYPRARLGLSSRLSQESLRSIKLWIGAQERGTKEVQGGDLSNLEILEGHERAYGNGFRTFL